ncbi:hypothetical protein RDSD_000257 [Oleidesulfovibrio alaskensis]
MLILFFIICVVQNNNYVFGWCVISAGVEDAVTSGHQIGQREAVCGGF